MAAAPGRWQLPKVPETEDELQRMIQSIKGNPECVVVCVGHATGPGRPPSPASSVPRAQCPPT